MNITAAKDKSKIIKDLKDAVAAQPNATTAEIKSYAEESKLFVAMMVEREDKNSIKTLRKEVNALVNLATTLTEKTEARKTRRKDKKSRSSKAAKEESESELFTHARLKWSRRQNWWRISGPR